ncbi:MopE-related protein [Flavobacterium sp.]|uniref:MopE-related protein n=1 Tax=Flavobacterium sp. TaxID=239 RepID=UPI0039E70F75
MKFVVFVMLLASLFFTDHAVAQIALRASSTATTTSTTVTINKPAGLVVGDVMLAQIMQSGTDGSAFNDATSSGWTFVAGSNMNPSGNSRYRGTILYKIATATDVAATSFAFTLDGDSDDGQGGISAFSGVDIAGGLNENGAAGGPFDVDPGNAYNNIAADSQLNANGITTSTANAAVIFFGMMANDTNGGVVSATNPSSWTELYDEDFDNSNLDTGIISSWGTRTTAGATGNAASNLGASTTNGAILIALRRFTGTISTGTVTGPICAGSNISVPYTITGTYATGNVFTAQLSSSAGSFSSPTAIGTATATTAGSISATIPAGQGAGSNYRIRVVSNFPPATGSDNGANLTIVVAPTASAGSAFNACISNTNIAIGTGATAGNNSGVLWTSNGTGTINSASSLNGATYTPGVGEAATVTFTLTASGNSPCGNATSNKVMTFFQQPTATGGGSATICVGQPHVVSGMTSSNGAISWTENGAGSITANGTTTAPTYTPAAGDAGNTVTLTMTVANSPCTSAQATYTIQVNGAATANAGTAVSTCENAGAVNITTGATSTNNAGVLWTSNGSGTFTNDTSLTLATYEPSAADILAGSVTLTLTATGNSPCANASNNKTLTIRKLPTASAGGSVTICQNQTHQVVGATASNGTISWTENGAGSITAGGTTTSPTYTAAAGDAGNTVTLTMTVTNNPCPAAQATYTINVLGAATANAGSALSMCSNAGATNISSTATATNYSAVAWTSNGTGTFAGDNTLNGATYNPSAADILAGSVTLTLTAFGNSPCGNITSNKVLTIRPVPVAADVVICQGQPSAAFNASGCGSFPSVDAGANFPTAASNSGTGTAWSATNNVYTDNTSYTTITGSTSGNTTSQTLIITGYNFAIPANAIVEGVSATVGKFRSGGIVGGEAQDNSIRLVKGGSAAGDNKAAGGNWSTSSTATASYGGVADLWNVSLTPADVNASNFGVAFAATVTQSTFGNRTANLDYISLTVTYRIPGQLEWYTVSSGGTAIGTGSSFNPVGVVNSGLADTNTPGITTYYVECTSVAGCRTAVNYVINALPTVNFTGLAASYCEDASAVTLTGNHAGGTFSGAGITDNGNGTASFNPATAGVGPHAITYTYTDGNTCVNNNVQNVSVLQNVTYYQDFDNDGFGNAAVSQVSCTGAPVGYVVDNTDCNDNNNAIHATFSFYADVDGDSFGAGALVPVCAVDANTPPAGYSLDGTDCNDNNAAIHATFPFYADVDGDSYGAGSLVAVCAIDANTPPAGYSLDGTDCDDNNAAIHTTFSFYVDADNDTYGTGDLVSVCAVDANTPPTGYSLNNTDCNDSDAAAFQSATLYIDADSDGYSNGVSQVVCYGATIPTGYLAANTMLDCNDSVAAINPGHAEVLYNGVDDNCDGNLDEGHLLTTTLLPGSCGATLASIGSLIGIQTVGGHSITGYRIRATLGAEVQVIEKNVPHFTMPQFPSHAYASTYSIEIQLQRNGVWLGYYGPACQVSTPAILAEGGAASVSPSQCGVTLNQINTLIATTSIQGVTGYRFRVTNLTDPSGPNAVQSIDRTQNWFSLQMLTRYNYGTIYRIEVAVKTTGDFGGFGSPCEITSPAVPSLINCGGTVALGTTRVAANSVSGATQYRFQIVRQLDNATATIDRNTNYFLFNSIPPAAFTPASLYSVRVAVMTAGTWSPFGDVCEITSPGATARANGNMIEETANENVFKVSAYPNPFTSDFNIELTSSSQESVQLKVYDMLGKLIESREVKAEDLNMEKVGAQYPSGVYNVIVTQGSVVKTLRTVKR